MNMTAPTTTEASAVARWIRMTGVKIMMVLRNRVSMTP
jgi:hypothetical protein